MRDFPAGVKNPIAKAVEPVPTSSFFSRMCIVPGGNEESIDVTESIFNVSPLKLVHAPGVDVNARIL
jgi:hypothetical protein